MPALARAADQALDRGLPVVLTTRCHEGAVSGVYGTEGGRQLRESGTLLAGDRPSSKARAKLMLALEYGDDPADVSEYFP